MPETAVLPLADPRPGDWLANKYRLDRVLGEGGMGIVYDATHVHLERAVAIKVIRSALSGEPSVAARMVREARTIAQIDNDHVVRVLDVGQLGSGCPFIVMERLEGENLLSLLERQGPLELSAVIDFLLQTCVALAEAHKKGIVHRDLKPENLFLALQSDGTRCLKVLDFGIAKQRYGGSQLGQTDASCVLGSPQYMAPEQLRSDADIDERADIWALGVVLYELLTGCLPFQAQSIAETCARVLGQAPVPPSQLRPDLPSDVSDAILCCLSKDKRQRFGTALELAQAVAAWGTSTAYARLERIARLLGASDALPIRDTGARTLVHSSAPVSRVIDRATLRSTLRAERSNGLQWLTAAAAGAGLVATIAALQIWRNPSTPTLGAAGSAAFSHQHPLRDGAAELESVTSGARQPALRGAQSDSLPSAAPVVSPLVEPIVVENAPGPARARRGQGRSDARGARATEQVQDDVTKLVDHQSTPTGVDPEAQTPGVPTATAEACGVGESSEADPSTALDPDPHASASAAPAEQLGAPTQEAVDPFDTINFGGRL